MTVRIFRPTYLIEELGELGRLPDGAIVNIGGTAGPYFTVGGKALMFADGSASAPSTGGIALQTVYDNGLNGQINLSTAKNFVLNALGGNKVIVDAQTGAVTIEGDLTVLGASTVIEGTVSNLDQLNIGMPNGATVGFTLQPNVGVTPLVDLFQVSNVFGGPPVFKIDALGATTLSNLYVTSGTINGLNLAAVSAHLDANALPAKHTAAQISYNQGANSYVVGGDVQAALDSIESAISSFTASDVQGYEHVQLVASDTWTVVHGSNSKRLSTTVWDTNDEQIIADSVIILTPNTVEIRFNTPITGRAILMIF